jgi:gliding motility-associated-like protein
VQQLNGNSAPYAFSLDGIQFQDVPAFTAQYAGWFTVLVRDSYNCIFKDSIQVDALPPLVASLPNGVLACDSSSIALTPIVQGNLNQVQYKWWNGATEASTRATEAGTVWVDVRNVCETKHVEAQVQWADVADDFSYAYLPNIFMPDAQDVRNASFRPIFVEGIQVQQYRLEIYDRWGSLLFQTKQADLGWEGTLKSKIIDPGVFVWILKADIWYCGRLIHLNRSGDVTIMR